MTSQVETVVCGTPAGKKPRSGLGQDALNKGRRPGGGPLNKGVIQLSRGELRRSRDLFSHQKLRQ